MTMLVVSLAGITVIGGALIAAFLIVRRKLLLPALPKLPPSGAAPWRRERSGDGMDRDSYAPPASAAVPAAPITEPIFFQPQAFPAAYVQQRVSSPASPMSAPLGDYTGLANQGFPPGFPPQAQGFPSPQSAPVEASPAPHLQQQGNRPRLRRNSLLHGTNSQPSLPSLSLDTGAGLSSDSGALSDPHVQAMIRQYSQKGQAVRQSGQQPPGAPFPGV